MTESQTPTLSYTTRSVPETMAIGRALGAVLDRGDVVALVGPLGAGKTQFVRGLAMGLGADPRQVASPTYVLMQEYDGHTPLVHIDAYRLQGLSDVESIGWSDELLADSVTAVEWADRIADELPADALMIMFEHADADKRCIMFRVTPTWQRRLNHVATTLFADPDFSAAPTAGGTASPITEPPTHTMATHTPCPICRAAVNEDAASYPFCSDRCRLVDLNRWFNGEYRLSRPIGMDDDLDVT